MRNGLYEAIFHLKVDFRLRILAFAQLQSLNNQFSTSSGLKSINKRASSPNLASISLVSLLSCLDMRQSHSSIDSNHRASHIGVFHYILHGMRVLLRPSKPPHDNGLLNSFNRCFIHIFSHWGHK